MKRKKKEERHDYIRKRAEELSRSGDFSGWLPIELLIRKDGYSEARRILDDRYIREQLDSTCKIAQPDSEKENRALFKKWFHDFVSTNFPALKEEFPGVSLSCRDNTFHFISDKKEIEVYRAFSSKKLAGRLHYSEEDGRRYVADYHNFIDKNFDQFDITDLRATVRIVSTIT